MEFIRDAGWGIYPVFLFGAFALVTALRHALGPAREFVPVVVGSSVATFLAGLLGAVTGLQHSVEYITDLPPERRWIFLIGLRESLNNVVAAFVIIVFVCMIATVGSYRLVRRNAS